MYLFNMIKIYSVRILKGEMIVKKTVIIGGVAGGASTAARLRRLEKNSEIIIIEKGEFISFANCGLPYYVGNIINDRKDLIAETPKSMKEKNNIEVRIRHEVVSIDRKNKKILVKDLSKEETYWETYDKLVIATGSSPIVPQIPGINLPNIFNIWTIPDSEKIREYIKTKNVDKVAVIGGGFIGIEMADNLKNLGLEVVIVEMANQVLAPLDIDMVEDLQNHIMENGVELVLGDGVKEFKQNNDKIQIVTSQGKKIYAEMVILAIGVKANSRIADEAGLDIGERGGIVVDSHLLTSDKDIYAAGDVIQVEDFVNKIPTMIPLAGPANKQGRIVANNIAGKDEEYKGTQGTSIVKVFEMNAAATGANEKILNHLGNKKGTEYEVIKINTMSHAGYYPNPEKMTVKAIFELSSGKLLGAQVVGRGNVDKRIDILATVIRYGGTMESLKELELAYAPPFSSSKDPINILGFISERFLQ